MKFALRNKVPNERPEALANRKDYVLERRDDILDSLGIGHTKKTRVGNEFIRGVSGGERKRVSLAEVMAGQVSGQPILDCISSADIRTEPRSNVG
jgi:ABC-type hemin transport system ATPase subunit